LFETLLRTGIKQAFSAGLVARES